MVNDRQVPEPGVLHPIPEGKIPALTSSVAQNARKRAMKIQDLIKSRPFIVGRQSEERRFRAATQ